ncbi:MAG: hypothetical protein CMI02_03300 [Oceanospirillaceae bacterium]|nr:hypothetical protein [Oceanospirillaceae bacterium]MBT11044.1 hypothetical protein [Oceanospirillaceae bacterium]|tara:strand:+ start:228095 stop:228700 length:606 start_codon:yes stop_codon:yes gene_type:complete
MKYLLMVMLSLLSVPLLADDTNVFINKTVGIQLVKPDAWVFMTADQNLESLKQLDMKDKEFHQTMVKYSSVPLVAMARHKEPFDDLNPSFKLNVKPLGQFKGASAVTIAEYLVRPMSKYFDDFRIMQSPVGVTVGGLEAGYVRINYSLAIPDGRKFPTTSEIWVVPRGDYFFMIGAGTRQDEATGNRDDIAAIIDSIKFLK